MVMREGLFIFLYGALFFMGLFLAPFWAHVARLRVRRIAGRWTLRSDRYFMLAAGIAVLSFGDALVFGARTWGNIQYGISPILRDGLDGLIIGVGLCIILLGKAMLVWLADLEKEPTVWTWTRWLAVTTIGWGIAAILVEVFARP
jgi:hypothetical protein